MKTTNTIARLYKAAWPQIPVLSIAVITEILKYGVTLWIGLLGVKLLRMARAGEGPDMLIPTGVLILVLAVLRGAFGYLSPFLSHVGAYRLLAVIRYQFYQAIEPLAPAVIMQRRTGDIASVAGNNIETLEFFFAHTIAPMVTATVIPIMVFFALFSIHPTVAWTFFLCTFLIALLPRMAFILNKNCGEQLRLQLADLNSFLIDTVQGVREILAFSRSKDRYNQVMELNRKYHEGYRTYIRRNSFITAAHIMVLSGGAITILAVSTLLSSAGEIDPLNLPIVFLFASIGFSSMANIVEISKQFAMTFSGAKRLYELMDMKPDVKEPEHPLNPEILEPSVSFENVSFGYQPDKPVLHAIDFEVPKGKTVAIVGMTGAGKTTIAHLIMRFWDPGAGKIMIGGYDLRDLSLSRIRGSVSIVSQDIFLLNTSILENIRLGRGDASDDELLSAAKAAKIHDFISSLPNGYQTIVGERGIRLSGGERQRIAIARALLKNAPILILDEASSALDTCTELEIREAIWELSKGKTLLIIAHRLSTVSHADRILVLEKGRIIEEGTHKELLRKNAVYASLIEAQKI
ncbi:MAG: ABC transporter ATP-binding protein [Euryarchaeota archaeon]|nr:ABC transporter ATP-binding protein [Euryarchaeota archaeon]